MKRIIICALLLLAVTAAEAQTTTLQLLSTKEDGPWPCAYYLLNSNEELGRLEPKSWAGRCVDEGDWVLGYGPLSNSPDVFRITPWGSEVQPLLVRRHFTLSADDVAMLDKSTLTLTCSYDENPRLYLNGVLLWVYNGWNDNDYATRTFTPRHKALLREGDNVLAVSLMQGAGGGHIDMGLTLTRPENADAIRSVRATDDGSDEAAYDLKGIRQRDTSGVYIVRNKKFTKK